ncbi:ATP-dependent bile acid permease [Paramyrothecium foliicola]|nr:ATP-dependent bile acid permease [Paramyrothecium foliicola]
MASFQATLDANVLSQAVLGGPRPFRPLIGNPRSSSSQVIIATAVLSITIFTTYLFQGLIYKALPRWLKPFAAEPAPDSAKRRAWSVWTLCLGTICLAGLSASIAPVVLNPSRLLGLFELVPWVVATLMTAFGRPIKTPKFLLLQYLLMLLSGMVVYSLIFLGRSRDFFDAIDVSRLLLDILAIVVIGNMPLRDPSWDPTDIGNARQPPSYHVRSPEDNLTLFQFWTMSWVYPLAKVCRNREITVEDVWQLPYDFQHSRLYVAFRDLEGKLLYCLIEANGLDLFVSTVLGIIERVAEVTAIRISSDLYSALDHGKMDVAVYWCLVILCIDALRQTCKLASSWSARKSYERSRGETFIALFGKLLTRAVPGSDTTEKGPQDDEYEEEHDASEPRKLKGILSRLCGRRKRKVVKPIQQPASNAKVVNLVRGDTYEISQRFWEFSRLVSQPIKLIFTIYYLIDIMGWPSCVGFGLMILFFTCNSFLVKHLIKLEWQRTAHSDKRAQAVSHFVEASRPLKLNGWTAAWSERIMKFRAMEMLKRLQIAHVMAAISTVNITGGAAYPLASIVLYTLVLGRGLPNDVIWPSLQLFGHLEVSLKEAFDLISATWKATIPVERVHQYMAEPDRNEILDSPNSNENIAFHNASFAWQSTSKVVLRNLDLEFPCGLTLIRGKVGSGKSSLLLAALNEMELYGGGLSKPSEPIGYAQQLPWLQNKTIRENILFHHPLDAERYRLVLHACALNPDLATFPAGDLTKLEEGGVGLSGGQKARVALARAIYSPCRILLLDDPLAALDHDTASTIVRRFLVGPLAKDRSIVMVTHRDDLVLSLAQQVVQLENGEATILSQEQIQEELKHPYHASSSAPHPDEGEIAHAEIEDHDNTLADEPEEAAETGEVSLAVYTKYMEAGGWHLWALLALFYGISRFCDISRARLLEAWGNETVDESQLSTSDLLGLPDPSRHPQPWIYVLSGLSMGQIIAFAIAQLLLARISVDAAQGLFKAAVDKVSKATFRYHDTTPTGQLKNRLIADMGMVDGGILSPLEAFVYSLIALVLSLVAITTHQPALLVILLAVSALFVYFYRIYVPISRSLRRMEMRYLTPIIANIGVLQDGLVTVRAFRVESHFQDRHLQAVDDFQKQDHFFWSVAFWLNFRLNFSWAIMRAVLVLFMVWVGTAASAVGFVLTQMTIAMTAVQQLCEKFAQLQLDAVSLERVNMLNRIPEEPGGGEEPPEDWPRSCDSVKFEDMSFKYSEELPKVLEQVSFEIPGGSTCAVLGRTGSGKSTIANALLATQTPCDGVVKIGSMDLSKVNRQALRNRVTFIQQDPTLFPGTLRDNIDPEGKFSEAAAENAIHRVLGPGWGLDTQIDAGGKNLSQGQRQLVGIGRAVLRRSGLVILDEATASIDRGTAALVQRVLREELAQSTVITIAHRLEAVEDANWCLRLDNGRVMECGPTNGLGSQQASSDE